MTRSALYRRFVCVALLTFAMAPWTVPAQAGVIVSVSSGTGAYPASPDLQTIPLASLGAGGMTAHDARQLAQTIQVSSSIQVDKIYITAAVSTGMSESYNLRIFQVADVMMSQTTFNGLSPTFLVNQTIAIDTTAFSSADPIVITLDLTGADEITLSPLGGTNGYAIQFFDNNSGTSGSFNWKNDTTNPYAGGRSFRLDQTSASTNTTNAGRDFSLALVAVPEPASLGVLVLGAVAVIGRRKLRQRH